MKKRILSVVLTAGLLGGCVSTSPKLGGGQGGGTVTGSTAGATNKNANSQLANCPSPLGTISVYEDTSLPWYAAYQQYAPQLGSTTPVIRMMIQQSGCFVVVERGAAMSSLKTERELMASGEMRTGSKFGKGQMVAADYTLKPSIQFSQRGTGGMGAMVGGLLGPIGSIIGGGLRSNEAASTLLLIDNRSGAQISAAVGNAKNMDFSLGGGAFGGAGGGVAGAFSNTPQGKVVTAAFADSFNQMVKALKDYKMQTISGGMGKGGKLGVAQ